MAHADDDAQRQGRRRALGTIASGFVGALALATSTYDVYLQRQQVRAEVWPRLVWELSLDDDGLSYSVHNRGVGPAEVRRVRVIVDGQPASDWLAAEAMLLRKTSFDYFPKIDTVENQILSPGQTVTAIRISDMTDARHVLVERRRLEVEICYCSSLGDCWSVQARGGRSDVTKTVPDCAPDAHPFSSVDDGSLDTLLRELEDAGLGRANDGG